MYLWKRAQWPAFTWRESALLVPLATARYEQGRLLGRMQGLGFELQQAAHARAVTEEVVRSSAIEGETLDYESVRSSVARRLGLPEAGLSAAVDRRTEGVVEMTLDATTRFDSPLTRSRLFGWHAALFPTGYSGLTRIKVGAWRGDRSGPMQVVSGPVGRPRVHFEAPPAERLDVEMKRFLAWFNTPPALDGLVRAALAHLWFVTVHPFEDGNGRIARALTDMALAQLERTPQRFYSMSSQLLRERRDYYDVLERTQKGPLDVTDWLVWFLGVFTRALTASLETGDEVLRRAEFWRRHARHAFSERQRAVLDRFLGPFEGKLTAKKWAALAGCSVDTAQRDLRELVEAGVLVKNPGGSKNTSYSLAP